MMSSTTPPGGSSAPPGSSLALRYLVERLRLADVPQIQVIEGQSFSSPWSAQAYEQDLSTNKLAHYVVLREISTASGDSSPGPAAAAQPPASVTRRVQTLLQSLRWQPPIPETQHAPIVGFAGTWIMVDEAHLVTIAVAPGQRGKGLGELLLVSMIDLSSILGAGRMTLEVRVSNHVAQSLYRKFGFKNEGVRRRYYSDNGEDAMIMTTDVLTSPYYQAHYQELKRALLSKLSVSFNHLP
jgi:[ribosomal protein S18]-alanine N-acetyltransferase